MCSPLTLTDDLVAVPVEEFHRLNKSSEARYKMVPEDKGGGYAAYIEVFHHLHCLVRRSPTYALHLIY